jgi:sugar lactone lactonase YvrE
MMSAPRALVEEVSRHAHEEGRAMRVDQWRIVLCTVATAALAACSGGSSGSGGGIAGVDTDGTNGGFTGEVVGETDEGTGPGLDGISIPDGGFIWPNFDTGDGNSDTTVAPDTTEPDTTEPDTTEPDTTEPDVVEPDVVEPDTTEPDTIVTPPEFGCEEIADLPIPFDTLQGYTTSEDFTFDDKGNLIATHNGNLIKMKMGGAKVVITPNVGFTAGMAFLPTGEIAVASVDEGALWRIAANGSKVTVLSGLQYPNGLDIDEDGRVYVAEQDGQRLRRVDPWTGDYTVLGEDLCNANGVSFAPDYQRIYVGSFGCGVIYAIDRIDKDNWEEPYLFATIGEEWMGDGPDDPEPEPDGPPAFCDGQSAGDMCQDKGSGPGTCDMSAGGDLVCSPNDGLSPLVLICQGKGNGDVCEIEVAGLDFSGFCETNNYTGAGNNVLECDIDDDPICQDKQAGDPCLKLTYGYPYFGTCSQNHRCNGEPPSGNGGNNGGNEGNGSAWGLDGLNVDACGYVYVTEYVDGVVWRVGPDGKGLGKVANLPSSWIPNMHWGSGIGGWDPEVLYVADRDQGRLFAIQVGKPGKETTKP